MTTPHTPSPQSCLEKADLPQTCLENPFPPPETLPPTSQVIGDHYLLLIKYNNKQHRICAYCLGAVKRAYPHPEGAYTIGNKGL